MPQNIRDVMTSNPCTIDADRSVAYAAKMMLEEDVGLAPIVEGGKLIGMLTDRDIATRVAADGRDPDQVKVRDVASTQLFTIGPRQDLDEALRMMAKHQVRRLPVVEADGRLVGVVAQADIAREGNDTQTGQLVEEISESGGQMSSIEEGQFPVQFPRQIEEQQPESLVGEEPQVEEQREEDAILEYSHSPRSACGPSDNYFGGLSAGQTFDFLHKSAVDDQSRQTVLPRRFTSTRPSVLFRR